MATRTNLVGTLGFLLLTTIGPNVAAEKNTVATSTATTTVEAGKLSVASVESLLAEKRASTSSMPTDARAISPVTSRARNGSSTTP